MFFHQARWAHSTMASPGSPFTPGWATVTVDGTRCTTSRCDSGRRTWAIAARRMTVTCVTGRWTVVVFMGSVNG